LLSFNKETGEKIRNVRKWGMTELWFPCFKQHGNQVVHDLNKEKLVDNQLLHDLNKAREAYNTQLHKGKELG